VGSECVGQAERNVPGTCNDCDQHDSEKLEVVAHTSLEDNNDDHHADGQASFVMRAAIVHVIGDIIQSIGVAIAALLIWLEPFDVGMTDQGISKCNYADPATTFLFSVLVLLTTFRTLRDGVNQILLPVPPNINLATFKNALCKLDHVLSVHDLHVWSMGTSVLCTGHVLVDELAHSMRALEKCISTAEREYGILHATFQVEVEGLFDHCGEKLQIGDQSCHALLCNSDDPCKTR